MDSAYKKNELRVLSVSNDEQLGYIRAMVLTKPGFRVATCAYSDLVARLMEEELPQVIVLCHTLSLKEQEHVVKLAWAANPRTEVLVLVRSGTTSILPDAELVHVVAGPDVLIAAVKRMARRVWFR